MIRHRLSELLQLAENEADCIFSAAASRNAEPIFTVLAAQLEDRGNILELASGGGLHAALASLLKPGWQWQSSDMNAAALSSLHVWRRLCGQTNFLEPVLLNTLQLPWVVPEKLLPLDAIVAVNLLHISDIAVCQALFCGAQDVLSSAGKIIIYGPFKTNGQHNSTGNALFDARLRAENAMWGIRDIAEVTSLAAASGFILHECVAMPANNQTLIFVRQLAGVM